MTPAEFAAHVHEFAFASVPEAVRMTPEVAALGVVGEVGEWLSAETVEEELLELGDVLFYVAAMAHLHHLDFVKVLENAGARPKGDALRRVAVLAEAAKKSFYGRPHVTERVLGDVVAFLPKADFGAAFHANRVKLQTRWPKGFGR